MVGRECRGQARARKQQEVKQESKEVRKAPLSLMTFVQLFKCSAATLSSKGATAEDLVIREIRETLAIHAIHAEMAV